METEHIPISNENGVTVTRYQQVRKPSDCDKHEGFHTIPCSREDRDCEACIHEANVRTAEHLIKLNKERVETERKRKIPILFEPIGNLRGSELLKELDDRVVKRWDEIKAIESEDECDRSEAVSEYEKKHGIDRDKELSLVSASFGHYGGTYVEFTDDQARVLKKVFGRLYPRKQNISISITGNRVYFANGTKGSRLLDAVNGVLIKLDYPEYWD